jgi:hypothetical protein
MVVLPVAEEGFLALGAHEVLHVPVLPQRRHHSLFNRTPKAQEENVNIVDGFWKINVSGPLGSGSEINCPDSDGPFHQQAYNEDKP